MGESPGVQQFVEWLERLLKITERIATDLTSFLDALPARRPAEGEIGLL